MKNGDSKGRIKSV